MTTFDSDYLALHNSGVPHAGIAWWPQRKYRAGQLLQALLLMHGVFEQDEMRNRLEYL